MSPHNEHAAGSLTALDVLIPTPRLVEIDRVELDAPPEEVWLRVRHGNLAPSPLIRTLFAIRTRGRGKTALQLDDLRSTPQKPGFQLLVEEPGRELAVGAIGRVWESDIPFVHVATADEYAAFDAGGFAKVAWAIRLAPRDGGTHLELEVRVDTTDEESWPKFRRYFLLIGIGSRLIRRLLLRGIARDLGVLPVDEDRPLPGDDLLPDATATVRARAQSRPAKSLLGVRLVHRFMEAEQLRQLAARAEGRLPRDDWRDVIEGVGGAAVMTLALLSPFLRGGRSHWGLSPKVASKRFPGDELVPEPRWSWTHGVEIDAPAAEVWPWVAQIGADRGGFYSYQALENVAGCEVSNAETVHPDWEVRVGDRLVLHPKQVALPVVACEPGSWFVVHAAADENARAAGRPWVTASWLFHLEPLAADRCRLVSRYRADCSDDLASRLRFGPTLVEPIGFAMDRRMLLGVKERAERRPSSTVTAHGSGGRDERCQHDRRSA